MKRSQRRQKKKKKKKKKHKAYVHWELKPTGKSTVWDIYVKSSGSGTAYDVAEYRYDVDQVWKGGSKILAMSHSKTSKDCD